MSSIFKISSFDEYKEQYQKSVENPAEFWAGIADHYQWQKKWQFFYKFLVFDVQVYDVRVNLYGSSLQQP